MNGEDRLVLKDGQLVRMAESELESLLEVAFKAACHSAFKVLGVEEGSAIESICTDGEFGSDRISVRVKLRDGRQATASASLWDSTTRAN